MPSISLNDISWASPEGLKVLSGLSLVFQQERVGIVGRNGIGKSTLLKLIAGELSPFGGRIRVEGSIGRLRQMARVSPDDVVADLFDATAALRLLRRAEAGQAPIEELAEVDWTLEARAAQALANIGLSASLDTPLASLSGGQRTRAALAGAAFTSPDFLLLDEPTNDLDRDGRRAVHALLEGWKGGALVVSHDRELLETCEAIVELTSLGATRYGGNWSAYQARKAVERDSVERDLDVAERRVAAIARRAQQAKESKQRRDAAGSRKGDRGELPRILVGARRDHAEKSGGDGARLADRMRREAEQRLEAAKGRVERGATMSVELASTGLAAGRRVLDVECLTFGHDPGRALLECASLSLTGAERVAICGPNGAGKSTLLGLITGELAPWHGSVRVHLPYAYFDQRMRILCEQETLVENFRRLNPGLTDNDCRSALARFQFKADAAERRIETLSGGQLLSAGLACVLGGPKPPPLLLLDEPTNHLDIESIASVEAGLRAFDGALLAVSHDEAFLEAIGVMRRVHPFTETASSRSSLQT